LICRIAFFAFCALPTAWVVVWIGLRHHPRCVAAREAQWSAALGLDVSLGGVSTPRPGITLLSDVRLADRETHEDVARVRVVQVTRNDEETLLVLSQAEVKGDRLGQLWESLHDRILRRDPAHPIAVQWSASEVTLDVAGELRTLTDVRGRVDPTQAAARATFEFRIAGQDMPDPVQVCLIRNRQMTPSATRVELHTGQTDLSCSMLSAHVPSLQRLGDACRFRGSIWAMETAAGWQGEATGRLTQVDLDRLVSDAFPHKLSGTAQVAMRRFVVRAGRLSEATGCVWAGPGVVSRSLLTAAAQSMDLVLCGPAEQGGDALLPYRQLAFELKVDERGLTLFGQCDNAATGTILANATGPLLGQPPNQPSPVVALVRTLVPQSEVQVPATRETTALLHALPVPPTVAPNDQPASAPQPHLRASKLR